MTTQDAGRKGGQSKSEEKLKASRANLEKAKGKGGRPKGSKNKPKAP